jgi:hypothetical protein
MKSSQEIIPMFDTLVNTQEYSTTELLLFGVGCYMWVVVYVLYIREIHKGQCVGMPVFAACSNFAWEIVWGIIPPSTNMGPLLVWAYRAWFFLDLYIIFGVYRYGTAQIDNPAIKKYFKPLVVVTVIGMTILYYFFKSGGYDTPIGATSAYIAQMFISVLYLVLLLRHQKYVWQSLPISILRMVGTGLNTVFLFLHYPQLHFLLSLGVMSLIIDNVYIYLFITGRKQRVPQSALAG